ncbi:unnamed protein product [Victoria cruziana]
MKTFNCLEGAIERLRPLVGNKRWEYCVCWRLLDDRSCLEWTGSCCRGAEQEENSEQLLPVSPFTEQSSNAAPCRDMTLHHIRTKTCDLLSELPISIPLDSGLHGQAFLSNHPKWMISSIEDFPVNSEVQATTRVLIPVPAGLVELFISNHVPEDPHVVQFVMAQFNDCWASNCASSSLQLHEDHYQAAISILGNRSTSPQSYHYCSQDASLAQAHPIDHASADQLAQVLAGEAANYDEPTDPQQQQQMKQQFLDNPLASKSPQVYSSFQQWLPENLPWDATPDQVRLSTSAPRSFFGQQFQVFGIPESSQAKPNNSIMFEETIEKQSADVVDSAFQDKEIIKQETRRTDSISDCSDQNEDDEDQKAMERGGRRHQSKNLVAERKRRKKLNDRLYTLRSIVPKITKMDRASILGDAIEYVKELQKQVKDLQDELEDIPDGGQKDSSAPPPEHQNGVFRPGEYEESSNGLRMADQASRLSYSTRTTEHSKQNTDCGSTEDKGQQMEVQVEVTQVGEHEFSLKIFCENRAGGFSRLMQAMDSLGLEVITVNIITFRGLVLNLFKVEMRDNEAIQADQVRDSLLELTRNLNGWTELV